MSFLDFLRRKAPSAFVPVTPPGVIDDPRPQVEQDRDYDSREVASAGPVTWTEKPSSAWRTFGIWNQDGSSSCVGNGTAKVLGIENFIEEGKFLRLSARDIYSRRVNQDSDGMFFQDALDIASNHGCTLEVLLPSEGKNEADMNYKGDYAASSDQIALVFKAGGYVQFKNGYNIDELASIIEKTGKGIVIGFRFDYDEWNEKPVAKETSKLSLGHCVAVVDYTLNNGEKCLVIEDSWGSGTAIQGRRLITQDWLNKRCIFAGYFLDLKNTWRDDLQQPQLERPHLNFARDMKFGDQSDDVKLLQDMLKYEELFPVKQESTGYYGNITAKGVLAWQLRYNNFNVNTNMIAPEAELQALGGKVFGPKSRARANGLYQ